MLVGIHKDQYGKFCSFLQKYEEIMDYNKIDHTRLDVSNTDFWEIVKKLDLFIFRWRHIDDHHQMAKTIIPIIEKEHNFYVFAKMEKYPHLLIFLIYSPPNDELSYTNLYPYI